MIVRISEGSLFQSRGIATEKKALSSLSAFVPWHRCRMGGLNGSAKFPAFRGSGDMAGRGSDVVCMRAAAAGI